MRRPALSFRAAALVLAGGCAGVGQGLGTAPAGSSASLGTTLRLADGSAIGEVELRPQGAATEVEVHLAVPADGSAGAVRAFHGFHVHANDDPANGEGCVADPAQPAATWFVSADGHLRSGAESHGAHQGDMPPLLVNADGRAAASFTTDRLPLDQFDQLDGWAVIVHAGPDNLGNVPTGTAADQYTPNSPAATDKTHATGNAGDRLACGILHPR